MNSIDEIFNYADSLTPRKCHCAIYIYEDAFGKLKHSIIFSPDIEECSEWLHYKYMTVSKNCYRYLDGHIY